MEKNNIPLEIEDMPIRYFKMMNGDSIVAYVHDIDEEDAVIALEEPMVITIDEEFHYQFSPWFPFSKKNIHIIDMYNIMTEDDVEDDVKSTYLKLILDKIGGDGVSVSKTRH